MAPKANDNKKISKDTIYLILNLVLAVVTLTLCAIVTSRVMEKDEAINLKQISFFHGMLIFSQVLFQILLFLVKDKFKDKLRAVIVGLIYVIAMIVALVSYKQYMLFYFSAAIVVAAMAVNQFMLTTNEEAKKGAITNILLGATLVIFAVGGAFYVEKEYAYYCPMITVSLFLFLSLKKLLFPTLKLERIKMLINILVKTHTIDVIVCLIAFMIAFSFIIPKYEPAIDNFWDSLWYCFTVITTIGFGDFAATTVIGRILTVVLGIYGIVVVAIITSVVVNFYNEVNSKEKARDFIE